MSLTTTDQLPMNDDQWLAKLSSVAASDKTVPATVMGNPNVAQRPAYDPREAILHYQQQQDALNQPVLPPVHITPQLQAQQPNQPLVAATPEVTVMAPPETPTVTFAETSGSRAIPNTVMPDLAIINEFLRDESVGDILINGINSIYIDKNGKMVDSGMRFGSHEDVWEIAERIMKSMGQSLSVDRPMVDTRLPDGSRVNIIAPPMAVDGVSISIRKFPMRQITLETMLKSGQLTQELAKFLSECVHKRLNIIITGGTGSGKTTLLNALSGAIDTSERIVTIEDSAELQLQQPHVVRLESQIPATLAQAHQEVSIRDLVKNALRMRPDRIIIGESRGAEALDILQAMNTGHDGSMTTLHANTPRDALARLEMLVGTAMPHMPLRLVRQQIASTVNLIINMARCKDGVRRVMYVSEVSGMEGEIVIMQDLVVYNEAVGEKPGHFRWASSSPRNPLVTDAARISGMMRGLR